MTTNKPSKAKRADALQAMCSGLLPGVAVSITTRKRIDASKARKSDGPFYCPECYSDAIVRKCTKKDDHFAHRARLTPLLKSKESELHKQCKEEICSALQAIFPDGKWAIERPITKRPEQNKAALVPDISGRMGEIRVAIEVQRSYLTIPQIKHRTTEYTKRGVYILWIVPLYEVS